MILATGGGTGLFLVVWMILCLFVGFFVVVVVVVVVLY